MKRQFSNHGFTLIELLVVISIIALLIAILLPALRTARDVADSAVCLSNERQIGIGMHVYLEDFQQVFPHYTNWAQAIHRRGYSTSPDLFNCPKFPGTPYGDDNYSFYFAAASWTDGPFGGTGGYAINAVSPGQNTFQNPPWDPPSTGHSGTFAPSNFYFRNADSAKKPSGTVWVVDYGVWGQFFPGIEQEGRAWTIGSQVNPYFNFLNPPPGEPYYDVLRHLGNFNVLYLDGHAASASINADGSSDDIPWPTAWNLLQ